MPYKDHKQFRLQGFDYSGNGYYFVTICTHNRVDYFGEILLDQGGEPSMALSPVGKIARDELLNTTQIREYVILDEWITMPNHIHIIFIYKGAVQRVCNKYNFDFAWQPRFHDHIIRNERELGNIRRYIQTNVINWKKDRNNIGRQGAFISGNL